jgi:hypothetical protein
MVYCDLIKYLINNDKNIGANFGQNGKFVMRKGVKVVMDKPCT